MPDTTHPLLDAKVNILVDLPGVSVNDPPMDTTITVPTVDDEGEPMDTTSPIRVTDRDAESSRPLQTVLPVQNPVAAVSCSIILKDVSVKLKGKTSVVFPPSEEEMCKARVCLQQIDHARSDLPRLRGRKRQRSQGNRPAREPKMM